MLTTTTNTKQKKENYWKIVHNYPKDQLVSEINVKGQNLIIQFLQMYVYIVRGYIYIFINHIK